LPHSVSLITTLAAAFGLALVLGFVAVRIRLPALVGYLVAGIIIGPATPGFVADVELSRQLAEIGVMLLMFGVGLHLSWTDLWAVRKIALPGALVQIAAATALGAMVSWLWGWDLGAGIVFGLALSVASTVVLIRGLESRGLLDTINGSIAVGWLVVEDIVTVLVLVLLPPVAAWLGAGTGGVDAVVADVLGDGSSGEGGFLLSFLVTLGKVTAFGVFMYFIGRRIFPWLLWQVARSGSRELFTLCVISAAVGIAYAAAVVFDVSFALGAFLAGMVLKESALSHRAAHESLPLRDAFAVLFFVSVGMLFDPALLLDEPLRVVAVVAIVMVGKSVAASVIVLLLRYPLNTALTVSAGLAQIGEFSFILASLGVSLGMLPAEGHNLILAGALISIALNPFVFDSIEPLQNWMRSRSRLARELERPDDPLAEIPATVTQQQLTGHVVIVGYGRVGQRIGQALSERGIQVVVNDQNREIVEGLRERGMLAVYGNASDPVVMAQTHVVRARLLVIAVPDAFEARKMLEVGRALKPGIETVVRVHTDEEAELFRKEGAGAVFMGEHELATSMTTHILGRVYVDAGSGAPSEPAGPTGPAPPAD
jgi:CPA2 family monovalent cation:H+ antiporter-2